MPDWQRSRLPPLTGAWIRISRTGPRVPICWPAPGPTMLRATHINWQSVSKTIQPSENTFAAGARLFRISLDRIGPKDYLHLFTQAKATSYRL
jgi:hypothetical protein